MSTNRSSLSSTQSGSSSASNYPQSFHSNEKLISESSRKMQYQLHRDLLSFPGGLSRYRPYLRKKMLIQVVAMLMAIIVTVAITVPLIIIFGAWYLAFIPGIAFVLGGFFIFKTVYTYRRTLKQLDIIGDQFTAPETPIQKTEVVEKETCNIRNENRSSIPPPPLRPPPALTNYDFPTMNSDMENRSSMIQWVKIETFKIDMPKLAEPVQQ